MRRLFWRGTGAGDGTGCTGCGLYTSPLRRARGVAHTDTNLALLTRWAGSMSPKEDPAMKY